MATPTSLPKKPRRTKNPPSIPISHSPSQPMIQEDGPVASTSAVGVGGMNDVTATAGGTGWYQNATIQEIFEDLSSRFILNLPEEELSSAERICFQLEQAHWFYEDFIRPQLPQLPSYSLRQFSELFFQYTDLPMIDSSPPITESWTKNDFVSGRAYERFMEYKQRVPVCGGILINEKWDKCVLVKGWKSGASWGFPKGKINIEEDKWRCAAREVQEETGFDVTPYLNVQDYIEVISVDQRITLYICPGVPEDTVFETQTRKEISAIDWFKLTDLPTWKTKKVVGKKGPKFYMIAPFVGPLKQWLKIHRPNTLQPHEATPVVPSALPTSMEPVDGGGGDTLQEMLSKLAISAAAMQHAPLPPQHQPTPAMQSNDMPDIFKQLFASAPQATIRTSNSQPVMETSNVQINTQVSHGHQPISNIQPPLTQMPPPQAHIDTPQSFPTNVALRTPPPTFQPPPLVAKSPLGPARPSRHGRRDSDAEIVEKVGRVMERERKQKALLDNVLSSIVGPSLSSPQQPMMHQHPPPPPFPLIQPPPPPQYVLPNGTLLATPPRHHLQSNLHQPTFHAPSPTYPSAHIPMLLAQQAIAQQQTLPLNVHAPYPSSSQQQSYRPPIASPTTGHRADLLNMLSNPQPLATQSGPSARPQASNASGLLSILRGQ